MSDIKDMVDRVKAGEFKRLHGYAQYRTVSGQPLVKDTKWLNGIRLSAWLAEHKVSAW